jgi:hypothetical protein
VPIDSGTLGQTFFASNRSCVKEFPAPVPP